MTTLPPSETVGDHETVMRRVARTGITRDEDNGNKRPSSDAFLQGGPEGNVSGYLTSETTPGRIAEDYPGTCVALIGVAAIRAQGLEVREESPWRTTRDTATSPDARLPQREER